MKQNRITSGTVFFLAFALFALLSAIGIRFIRPVSSTTSDATLNSLTAQVSPLRDFSDIELAKSKELIDAAQSRLWDESRIQAFITSAQNAGWMIQAVDTTDGVFTSARRYFLRRPDADFRTWPDILKFLTTAARQRGFGVHALNIEADPGAKRKFRTITVLVSLPSPKIPEIRE